MIFSTFAMALSMLVSSAPAEASAEASLSIMLCFCVNSRDVCYYNGQPVKDQGSVAGDIEIVYPFGLDNCPQP